MYLFRLYRVSVTIKSGTSQEFCQDKLDALILYILNVTNSDLSVPDTSSLHVSCLYTQCLKQTLYYVSLI